MARRPTDPSWSFAQLVLGVLLLLVGVGSRSSGTPGRAPARSGSFEVGREAHENAAVTGPSLGSILFEVDPEHLEKNRSQLICDQLLEMVSLSSPGFKGECRVRAPLRAAAAKNLNEARVLSNSRYLFTYHEEKDGRVRLEVENPNPQPDKLDFERLSWNAPAGSPLRQREILQRSLDNFLRLDSDQRAFREYLLTGGLPDSQEVGLSESGWYVNKRTGEQLTLDRAYETFMAESVRNRSWVRAMTEVSVVLGGGAFWYYRNKTLNSEDWEYSTDWEGFRRKITEGIRFDTNSMWLNSPGHPLAGSLYYGYVRSNGYSALESLLMATVASGIWEVAVEYREVISINDMVFTPVAGAAIGEAMYQLATYFARSKGTWFHDVLLTLFGGSSGLHHWTTNHKAPRARHLDAFGFPDDIGHDFNVWGGMATSGKSVLNGPGLAFGLDMNLVRIPGYGKPGTKSRFFKDTVSTRLGGDVILNDSQIESLEFYAQAAWAGYHRQSVRDESLSEGDNRLSGYSFLIGPATGYRHSVRNLGMDGTDELAIVNVLGPSMELLVFREGWRYRITMDIFGDMAAVHSMAAEPYERSGGDLSVTKSILALHKYYFAFGMTGQVSMSAGTEFVEFGLDLQTESFASIQGFDRYQEAITDDFPLEDERQIARLWASFSTPVDRLKLILALENVRRKGVLVTGAGKKQSGSHGDTVGTVKLQYDFK